MSQNRPNIIWIFGDQQPGYSLSANGDPNAHTPNLDRMAAMGVNFRNAQCGFPLCCPFRGSLLSGQYPHRCVPGHEHRLPPDQPTIAHAFNDNGYDTAYFGKWHLDGFHERDGRAARHVVPPERRGGFSTWLGFENNNSQYDCYTHGHTMWGEEVPPTRLPGYETDALTDNVIEFIEKRPHSHKPFFAVLSVQPPHNPYIAPPDVMGRYNPQQLTLRPNVPAVPRVEQQARRDLAGAYAMIENLDQNVGRIREALTKHGIGFNTHLVFFSDHGDMHGSHGQFKKTTPYRESLNIPFIISGEQPAYDGRRTGDVDAPLNHVDIAPTTLGLCGIDTPEWMPGTDYSGYRLLDRKQPAAEEPDSAYIQSVVPTGHGDSVDKPWRGVVTRDGWKYVCFPGIDWLLFNLNEDPYEQVNLAHNTRWRQKRHDLNERLKRWIADTGDTFTLPDV
jgi:arylsulfatase A-like enzyme